MKENEMIVLKKALEKFGNEAQIWQTFEEIGELMEALNQFKRGRCAADAVIDEIADVSIMIDQLAIIFGFDKCKLQRKTKLIRLQNRLEKMEK